MTVSTIASVATGLTRSVNVQTPKPALSLRAVTDVSRDTSVVVTSAPAVTTSSGSLRVAAQNIAQAGAQVNAVDLSAGQLSALLSQIQGITTRASSSTLSSVERNLLNAEFQSLRQQINIISSGGGPVTTVSTTPLQLQYNAGVAGQINLSASAIFGNAEIDLSTLSGAQAAVPVVASALDYIRAQQAAIATLGAGVELASATVESAVQNIEASRSTITLADIAAASGAGESVLVKLQQQASEAAAVQTKLLPADILKLLGD